MPLFLLPLLGFGKSVLAFFTRPPGAYIGFAAILALSLWWFGQHEFNRGVMKCEVAHAEAAAQESVRQRNAITITKALSDRRTAKSTEINKGNEKVIIHVKDQAEVMPGASEECIPADIADGLRSIK